MCFSKELSLNSFLVGIVSSLALILFGNKKLKNTNLTIGLFYLFVSLMQIIDFMMWSDLKCENNLNKMASIAGPLFNYLQPVVFVLLASNFVGSNHFVPTKMLIVANILYCVYVADRYQNYLDKEELCTQTNDENHLDWKWKYTFDYPIYFCVSLLNYANFLHDINILIVLAFSYLLLILPNLIWVNNVGEVWCLLVTCAPLVPLLFQTFFSK